MSKKIDADRSIDFSTLCYVTSVSFNIIYDTKSQTNVGSKAYM